MAPGVYNNEMTFSRNLSLLSISFLASSPAIYGHDVITTKVTFDREIVRLFNSHCVTCHREGGTAFSLETYDKARPWAKAIGEEVLQRRMPPWGAVKGFGDFRNDQGLTAEQLELIVDWEEGGAPEGDEKDIPPPPKLGADAVITPSKKDILVNGDVTLIKAFDLAALWPGTIKDGVSFQVTATFPDGSIQPLLWLLDYKKAYDHTFVLRNPLELPAGTMIHGVPQGSSVALLPVNPAISKK